MRPDDHSQEVSDKTMHHPATRIGQIKTREVVTAAVVRRRGSRIEGPGAEEPPGPSTYAVRPARRGRRQQRAHEFSTSAASPLGGPRVRHRRVDHTTSRAPRGAGARPLRPRRRRGRADRPRRRPACRPGGCRRARAARVRADQELLGGGAAVHAVDGRPDHDGVRGPELACAAAKAVFGRAGAVDVAGPVAALPAARAAGGAHPLDAHQLDLDPFRPEPFDHD